MKKVLILISFSLLYIPSNAQYIGKKTDITHNYTHSYIEASFTPYQGGITIYWGDQSGFLRNQQRKIVTFRSFAGLIEYLEKFGWVYFEKFPPYEADNNFRMVFKRETKQS